MTKFWMVHGRGQGAPNYKHKTLHLAIDEAKRLARLHPEIEFVVLEAVEGFVKREFATFNYRDGASTDDEIPF